MIKSFSMMFTPHFNFGIQFYLPSSSCEMDLKKLSFYAVLRDEVVWEIGRDEVIDET